MAAAIESLERRTLLAFGGHDGHDHDDDHGLDDFTLESGVVEYCPPAPPSFAQPVTDLIEAAPPFSLDQTFQLHSRPSATKTVYLDFNGHNTSGTSWNTTYNGGTDFYTPAYTLDSDPNFSTTELERIQRIWQRVVEDFVPFDLNITTQEPTLDDLRKSGTGDTRWGVRVVIGGNGAWYGGGAGGVAYVGSFSWSSDTPCFVFEDNLSAGAEKTVAEATSHEIGHTVGLGHDGRSTDPVENYYSGHGSGATGWAPIMGVGYSRQLTQWSKGEYALANNKQDDLTIMTGATYGFGYRPDDHGNTAATGTALSFGANGVIERTTDVDVFTFSLSSTTNVALGVDPFYLSPNLDVLAELYNSSGTLVASSNPLDALNASINVTLLPGTYSLHISGVGKGDPASTGYSDYGSLGYYSISGAPPTNDLFAGRVPMTGATPTATGTNRGATKEAGEPVHAGNAGGRSAWWTWTAPADGRYFVTTAGSTFDTLLAVYTGSAVNALTPVASNDNFGASNVKTSRLAFDATAGTVYQIAVDGYNGAFGDIQLAMGAAMPAPGMPSNPTPHDVIVNTKPLLLDWDDAPHATSYDVFLGTSTTPINVTSSQYGPLSPLDGVRQWRVVAKNTDGATPGPQWEYTMDATAPTAALAGTAPRPAAGASTFEFTVAYVDVTTGLDVSTLGDGDVIVTGPNGFSAIAEFVGVDTNSDGSPRTATYRIPAPGGTWGREDAGSYVIAQRADEVRDRAGNARPAGTIGTIDAAFGSARLAGSTLYIDFDPSDLNLGLTRSGSNLVVTSAAGDSNFATDVVEQIVVNGSAGDDTLLYSGAVTQPIVIHGGGGNDALEVTGGTYTFTADAAATAANLTVRAKAGGTVAFAATQHLAGLVIDGGAVSVSQGGNRVIVTRALNILNNGRIDLGDNDLILDPGSTGGGASASDVAAWIRSAYNGAAWDGAGLSTSMADATTGLTTLGLAPAAVAVDFGNADTAVWQGHTVSANAILVKYTYAGDANLDGAITGDDYSAIDLAILFAGSDGYWNGDFNHDGVITGDDYSVIDLNILLQGAPL